jgi:hypothetical protein
MLSAEHGLPVEKLKFLKSEMEIVFLDDLVDKYGRQPAENDKK